MSSMQRSNIYLYRYYVSVSVRLVVWTYVWAFWARLPTVQLPMQITFTTEFFMPQFHARTLIFSSYSNILYGSFFCLFTCVYVVMCMYVYSPAKRYSFGNLFLEFRRISNLRALIQRRSFAFHIKYQFAHMLLRLKYASRYDNQILLSDYQHSYIYSSWSWDIAFVLI